MLLLATAHAIGFNPPIGVVATLLLLHLTCHTGIVILRYLLSLLLHSGITTCCLRLGPWKCVRPAELPVVRCSWIEKGPVKWGAKFYTPPPPTPENTLVGWGAYRRRGRGIKFLPRGASQYIYIYTHTLPLKMPSGQKLGEGGGEYIYIYI